MNAQSEHVSVAKVVRHFLRIEARKPVNSIWSENLVSWCQLADEEMIARARDFGERLCERGDFNPFLIFSVGIPRDDRSHQVDHWKRVEVRCDEIYVPEINERVNRDLKSVRGNLQAFADQHSMKHQDEFKDLGNISEEEKVVMLLNRERDAFSGRYQLLDGAHRVVAMCRAGIEAVEAFVGIQKQP